MEPDYNDLIPELHYYIHRLCTPNWKIEPKVNCFMDITYVVKGSAVYNIGDETFVVKKGDLICIPQNTFRAAVNFPGDMVESYAVNIFLRNRRGEDVVLDLPAVTQISIIPELVAQFHSIHNELLRQEFGYQLKIQGTLCSILCEVLDILLNKRRSENVDVRIRDTISYIDEHYYEPLSVNSMAERYRLHPVYFGSLFKESMGISFKQYLLQIRLNIAKNMLRSGEYNVGEVALMCGFSDVYYFSRAFKEKNGISPSAVFSANRKKKFEDS